MVTVPPRAACCLALQNARKLQEEVQGMERLAREVRCGAWLVPFGLLLRLPVVLVWAFNGKGAAREGTAYTSPVPPCTFLLQGAAGRGGAAAARRLGDCRHALWCVYGGRPALSHAATAACLPAGIAQLPACSIPVLPGQRV